MKMALKESLGFTVLSLLLPCLLLGLQAGCKTNPPTAAELQRLQGTREGVEVGIESNGTVSLTITGHSLHFQEQHANNCMKPPLPWRRKPTLSSYAPP